MSESPYKMEVKYWKQTKKYPTWEILWAVYALDLCSEHI